MLPFNDNSIWYFLSHRTLKIPSSINKPTPGSKIVGKTEQDKMHEFSNHCWLVNISTASTTWTIILMSASSPCKQTHYWPCRFDAVDFYRNFFFSSSDPVSSCWTFRDEIFATQQTTWKWGSRIPFPMANHFPCSQLQNLILPSHKMKSSLVQK